MDTQFLLEETKKANQTEVTKEIITDESMIVGGVLDTIEITALEGIEYKKGSSFLG